MSPSTRQAPARQRRSPVGKRTLAVAVATMLTAAGCGFVNSEDEDTGAAGTVSAYVSTEQERGLSSLAPKFEQSAGVTIDLTAAPTADLNEQLRVQLTSGTAADTFRVSPGLSSPVAVGVLGGQGELADLSAAAWTKSMSADMRGLASVDGKVYGFPVGQNAIVMAYNKRVFADAGVEPPRTWSELLTACDKLKAKGVVPISAGFTGGIYLQFWVYALAASLVYGPETDLNDRMLAGEVDFADHPAWTTTFEKFLALREYLTPEANGVSSDQSTADLAQGKAAMQLMVSSGLPALFDAAEGGAADFGVFALPATDDPAETRLPTAPDFLAVNKNTKNLDQVNEFLDFLAEPANVKSYVETLGMLPALDVVDDVKLDSLEPVLSYVDDKRTTPFANYLWPNGDTQQRLLQSGQQLLVDEISIAELLGQLDAEFDKGTP